jgi:hypothetical protein
LIHLGNHAASQVLYAQAVGQERGNLFDSNSRIVMTFIENKVKMLLII